MLGDQIVQNEVGAPLQTPGALALPGDREGLLELIEYASSFYTLYPGDVIITGTPEGVSPIQPGDVISAYVEQIGTMDVKVRAA